MSFKDAVRCSAALVGAASVVAVTSVPSFADSEFSGLGDLTGGGYSSTASDISADGSVIVGPGLSASGTEAFQWTQSGGMVELGDLAGGAFYSYSTDVSADGSVVVGPSIGSSGYEAFRWTQSGGMVGLGDLPGGGFHSIAKDINTDGLAVTGESASTNGIEAFLWTESGGMVGLGDLPGGIFYSYATGISADGSAVVGESLSTNGNEAFRWTESGGMVGLGDLPGGTFYSYAVDISADGSVVVGDGTSAGGQEAFRWTQSGGMVGLGDLPGGSYFNSVTAVSADGSVVVGDGSSAGGQEAFRWTQLGGMVGLGDLAGGSFLSSANDVSADGSVIVGQSNSTNGLEAFRWLDGTGDGSGMRAVADLLTSEGIDLGTWQLTDAIGVSDDGKVIFGNGTNPGGDPEAWRAVVDVGFASVEDFFGSLEPMAASAGSARGTATENLDLLMNVARFYNKRRLGGESRRAAIPWSSLRFASNSLDGLSLSEAADEQTTNVWAAGQMTRFDGDTTESDDLVGSFGISLPVFANLRMGVGYQIGQSEVLVSGVEGNENERSVSGFNGYLAYEPADHPLRVYMAASALGLGDDLERNYLNGIDPVSSRGSRDGRTNGGSVIAGWSIPAGAKGMGAIMPFAGYETVRVILDGYTETGGPFPAAFDKVSYTSEVSRLGAELSTPLRNTMSVWGSVAWAHRFDSSQPGISGHIAGLSSDFAFGSTPTTQNWTEIKGGINANFRENTSLHLSFGAALDGEEDLGGEESTRFGGTLGISVRL